MSANDDLLEILKEALDAYGFVRGGRMFGGVGVYFDDTFFAIITGGIVYLKTSDQTRRAFEAEGSRPFFYETKTGRTQLTSYWRLPDRLLDETDELREWARTSVAAAREIASAKKRTARTAKSKAKPKAKLKTQSAAS
jgi:DNA transformation protein